MRLKAQNFAGMLDVSAPERLDQYGETLANRGVDYRRSVKAGDIFTVPDEYLAFPNIKNAVARGLLVVLGYDTKDESLVINAELSGWSGGGGTGTNGETITQANDFAPGDAIYLNGAVWAKALATDMDQAEAVGVVQSATPASFVVIYSGKVVGLSGLIAGEVYFLSVITPGLLTLAQPAAFGQISKPMLVAKSATEGIVVNYRGLFVQPPIDPDPGEEHMSFAFFWGN